jgi:hypothetical protein
MTGTGPAVHRVLLRPLRAGRVADQAATGATTRTERTRRAAVRPSPSEASGLRSVPRAPTLQPQAATRTASQTRRPHAHPPKLPGLDRPEVDGVDAQPARYTSLIAGKHLPARPARGLDDQVPGRSGRLHASLSIRRRASGIWPPHARPPGPADRGHRMAAASPPDRPARRASSIGTPQKRDVDRDATQARRPTTPDPLRARATEPIASTRQRSRTTTALHADPDDYEPRSPTPPDPLSPAFPSPPCLPAPRTPCSLLHGPQALPRSPDACRRPASGLTPSTPGLACPVFVWQVEEGGGPARSGGHPLPRKPRREAKPEPKAGLRPIRLLRRTPRDEHPEPNTKTRTSESPREPRRTQTEERFPLLAPESPLSWPPDG